MIEIWKDIIGFENIYQVSNKGNVKRLNGHRIDGKPIYEKLLKPAIDKYGYYKVTLHYGKPKYYTIHRLVGIMFINNPNNKPQINHKDGNKLNNLVDNLEWATHSENQRHALNTGLRVYKSPMKGRLGKKSPFIKIVLQKDLNGNLINKFYGTNDAERKTGYWHQSISRVCRNERKTYKGFVWGYEK